MVIFVCAWVLRFPPHGFVVKGMTSDGVGCLTEGVGCFPAEKHDHAMDATHLPDPEHIMYSAKEALRSREFILLYVVTFLLAFVGMVFQERSSYLLQLFFDLPSYQANRTMVLAGMSMHATQNASLNPLCRILRAHQPAIVRSGIGLRRSTIHLWIGFSVATPRFYRRSFHFMEPSSGIFSYLRMRGTHVLCDRVESVGASACGFVWNGDSWGIDAFDMCTSNVSVV